MQRPATGLFKRLSSIVRRMDKFGDDGHDILAFLTHLALDGETVVYMAIQRARRMQLARLPATNLENAFAGSWMDGFGAGYLLASGDFEFLPPDPGPIPE